jgi:outer membrane protein TolC
MIMQTYKQAMRFVLMLMMFTAVTNTASSSATITEREFLDLLKQSHPFFAKEALASQIELEARRGLLGAQDWDLFSQAFFVHEEPAFAFGAPEKTNAFQFAGGVDRTFWKTGGRLSASFTSTRASLDIDPMFGIPDAYFENILAVTYTHPLMKNKRGFLDKLEYELKQYDIDFSDVRAAENSEDFLASAAVKFLQWAFLTEQKRIIQERLGLSEEELDRTQRKRQANLIDQSDVIRAEDAVRIWKQSLALIESQWLSLQAELATLTQDDRLYEMTPELDLYALERPVALDEAAAQMKASSRLLKMLGIRMLQLEYSRLGYEEASKPELSIVTSLSAKSADESLGESLVLDKPDATIGLQYRVPIGNRSAKSRISRIDLEIERLQREIDNVTLTLISAHANLYIQGRELEKVLALNLEQIESARRRTEEEIRLYGQGRGELTFVIQSQDNEQNAKLTYAQNALTYQLLALERQALMDQLYR